MSTFKNRRIIYLARSALQVREWEKKNLPNANGELALDLFLLICYHTLIDKPLTFKTLFCSLDFSESGVRKHIRELKKNQWIAIQGNTEDKRLKYVIAQPKMISAFVEYSQMLKTSFHRQTNSSKNLPF